MKSIIPASITGSTKAALLGLFLLCGCGQSVAPVDKFEGIQIVFENGVFGGTIGDASDDWQPIEEVGAHLRAVFPNPTQSSATYYTDTRVVFSLSQEESIRIWIESAPGRIAKEVYQGMKAKGSHTMDLNVHGWKTGIYRIYMTVYRDGKSYHSYGDLMISE